MNKMIKMATMVVSVGAMFGIVGCGGGNSPEAVAVAALEKGLKEMGMSATCKVAKSDVKGDAGVVYVDMIVDGKKEGTEKVDVHKENGVWVEGKSKDDPELKKTPREISLERIKEHSNAFNEAGWEYKVLEEKVNDQKAEIKIQALKNGKEQDTMIYQYTKDSDGIWRSACW